MRLLTDIASAPVAVMSYFFYGAMRSTMTTLRRARDRGKQSREWQTLSELLTRPAALPYVMVTGPRWNPHAAIAGAGPFRLEHSLTVDTAAASRSAALWTLVVYRGTDSATVAALDRFKLDGTPECYKLNLPPGEYSVILRFYDPSPDAVLPRLTIDDDGSVPARELPTNASAYLETVRGKKGWFYSCLHYHVYAMLRCRRFLGEASVSQRFLPVGNPETIFLYDTVDPGERVSLKLTAGFGERQRVYITLYNRASFPVSWNEITSFPWISPPVTDQGWYLIRIHGSDGSHTASDASPVQVTVS